MLMNNTTKAQLRDILVNNDKEEVETYIQRFYKTLDSKQKPIQQPKKVVNQSIKSNIIKKVLRKS